VRRENVSSPSLHAGFASIYFSQVGARYQYAADALTVLSCLTSVELGMWCAETTVWVSSTIWVSSTYLKRLEVAENLPHFLAKRTPLGKDRKGWHLVI
jgi:hypothetical protein